MTKLCIFAGSTIVSYVGWYLGEMIGLDFTWCFVLSGVGAIAGVYVGWKFAQRFD